MSPRTKGDPRRPKRAPDRPDVTINIAIPRELHRHLAITAAALDVSLKDALIDGARRWIAANAKALTETLAKLGTGRDG
jgi:hypothetical protein